MASKPANGNGKHSPAPLESKALVFAPGFTGFVPTDANGGTTDIRVAILDWYRSSWLPYACMRYRATKLIEAPLWIAEEGDEGEEWHEGDHPLAELLERPNPDMEMADLLELTSLYLDSTGACLWVKSRDRGNRTAALYPFSGEDFRVESADGRLFGRFRVRTTAGERIYGPDDVVFFRNADPASPTGHVAPLHAALARLGIDRTMVESITAGLRNAVIPGASLQFPPDFGVGPEQLDEFQARISAQYAAAKNHGKFFASNGELKRHELGFKGLNGGELGKEVEAAVCACFQTPPAVIGAFVGLVNSNDRHNMETAVRMFYDNAILPTWARMEKALTRSLLREVDDNPLRFIRFDKERISALQENQTEKAVVGERASDVLTINERRILLGYPPLDDDRGDVITGGRDSAAPIEAMSRREPAESKAISDEAKRDLAWLRFNYATKAHEPIWRREAAKLLAADSRAIGALAEKHLAEAKPADPESARSFLEAMGDYLTGPARKAWQALMGPLIEGTGEAAVKEIAAELGISFDVLQPGLLDYTEKEAAWLVTQVTDTTKANVRAALQAGLDAGESVPDIAKRIRESDAAFGKARSELIARTETTRVTNGAQRDSLSAYAAEEGATVSKSWLTARDGRVRDHHAALDGEKVGIDETFSDGSEAPHEPNCRCTLTYSLEDE